MDQRLDEVLREVGVLGEEVAELRAVDDRARSWAPS
jgi:hypothetical protein